MLSKIHLYINIIWALLLVVSGLAKHINPLDYWVPAFIGISYPFLLVFNIFSILLWFIFFKKKRNVFISIFAIIITWSAFTSTINISAPARSISETSLLTWNVKNFDLYNWSDNLKTRELMMELIEEKKPDILCLQEFYTEKTGKFKNIKEIKKRLGYKHHYFGETFNIKNNKKWGLITFSKFPIKDKGQIKFNKGSRLNSCIYTDIQISKDNIVRIYNTHLQSLHFGNDDYEVLKELKNEKTTNVDGAIQIAKKLKRGFQKRAIQAELIVKHKNKFKGKSIICGDFNDTPTSFAYQTLKTDMQDAFKEKGIGFGKTLVNPSPFFRIDFVLLNENISIQNYKTYKKKHSDHFPVQVYFKM